MAVDILPVPLPAARHEVAVARRGGDALALLTIYLVLLLAIPSNTTIAALGSLGRPALLWGLVLLVWWAISRLQVRVVDVQLVRQPLKWVIGAFIVLTLVSFAAAMLRGQPGDQISPAFTALLRMLSWAGVFLVTIDGIRTMNDLGRLTRRVVVGVGLLAGLGILQFLTGQAIIDFFSTIPGLSGPGAGVSERGGVVRSAGTAIHPLEYATALNAALPLAIATAVTRGYRGAHSRANLWWWAPALLITISALVGVSRSAIIGFVIGAAAMIPILPKTYRATVVVVGAVLAGGVLIAVPGLLGTTLTLFLGAGDDPSTASRVGGLERAPEYILNSPLYGVGFGTFLPRYYIFDNQWLYIAIELGLLGVAVLAATILVAIGSAIRGRVTSHEPDVRALGYALAVSMVVFAVLFAFFDGLAFPISAGLFFLFAGMCGSVLTVGSADSRFAASMLRHQQTSAADRAGA